MATKRQGRAGIFKGASRTPRKRPAPSGPQAALAALGGIAYTWDLVSDVLTWGPNAPELLGIAPKALPRTGAAFARMAEPGSAPGRLGRIDAGNGPGGAYDNRYPLRFASDHVVMLQDAGRWQPNEEGLPSLVRGLLRVDPCSASPDLLPTTVKFRSALLRRIQDGIEEALKFSHGCALVVGTFEDEDPDAMEAVARSIRPMLRRRDHFAALGPRRFALVLSSCPAAEAGCAMERLAALLNTRANLRLGAACAPDHASVATELLRLAEDALEAAVAGSEVTVLSRAPRSGAARARAAERAPYDLVDALNGRRLALTCRPVVDAHSRRPALLQAQAALATRGGRAVPLGAVPTLQETNLAALVDGRMLEHAADHLARRREERLILPIALATLHDPEWLPMLAAHLGARPGIESRLLIEVPEAALVDAGATRGRLDAMKALGIGIALSGFGTGHATGLHLQILPIDLLKIDGVFIQSLGRSTDDRLFVRTLIDIAHRVGIATVAEWVDDEASAAHLAGWGIDYLQGAPFGENEVVSPPQSVLRQLKRA